MWIILHRQLTRVSNQNDANLLFFVPKFAQQIRMSFKAQQEEEKIAIERFWNFFISIYQNEHVHEQRIS